MFFYNGKKGNLKNKWKSNFIHNKTVAKTRRTLLIFFCMLSPIGSAIKSYYEVDITLSSSRLCSQAGTEGSIIAGTEKRKKRS